MVVRLQRWFSGVISRHGMWLHFALLVVISYFALVWLMHERWWGERYRVYRNRPGAVRAPDRWFSPGRNSELEGWRLVGTVVTEKGEQLALLSKAAERRFLRPGQALEGEEGWQVIAVDNGAVTFRSGSRLQTLSLIVNRPVPLPATPPRAVRINLDRRVAGDLFPLLHWSTVPLGGDFIGMRLVSSVSMRNASTFGLLDGDTVESVNGLPMSPDGRERLVERFRNDESVNLGVRRNGQLVYLHFSLYDE